MLAAALGRIGDNAKWRLEVIVRLRSGGAMCLREKYTSLNRDGKHQKGATALRGEVLFPTALTLRRRSDD
jgi:hypothetical protein